MHLFLILRDSGSSVKLVKLGLRYGNCGSMRFSLGVDGWLRVIITKTVGLLYAYLFRLPFLAQLENLPQVIYNLERLYTCLSIC